MKLLGTILFLASTAMSQCYPQYGRARWATPYQYNYAMPNYTRYYYPASRIRHVPPMWRRNDCCTFRRPQYISRYRPPIFILRF